MRLDETLLRARRSCAPEVREPVVVVSIGPQPHEGAPATEEPGWSPVRQALPHIGKGQADGCGPKSLEHLVPGCHDAGGYSWARWRSSPPSRPLASQIVSPAVHVRPSALGEKRDSAATPRSAA